MSKAIPSNQLHEALSGFHWDLYKEVNGIRPRHFRYEEMSVSELEAAISSLEEDAAEAAEYLREEVERLAQEDAEYWRQVALTEAQRAELEAREAVRAHEERWMDRAAVLGAAGW